LQFRTAWKGPDDLVFVEQDLVGAFEMVEDTVGQLLLGRFEIALYAWN
jgi:hypothetical protein